MKSLRVPRHLTACALLLALLAAACDNGATPAATPVPAAATATTPATVLVPTVAPETPVPAGAVPAAGPAGVPSATPGPTDPIAPAWARDAVLYQIFVRAFTPEGTLAAAQARLSDLNDLGVNLIYLMPIHPIGLKNRKGSLGSPYSVQDYSTIDPALGTEADLKAFVTAAHQLGMHVIMDFVANHTAWDNVLTVQHPDWYAHGAGGVFVPPKADWSDVIQLDFTKPALRQYLIDVTTHYVIADGVDGFRCDYSSGVPLDFWQQWRAALKQANPNVFLLSENSDPPLGTVFDATYDPLTYSAMTGALMSHRPQWLINDPLIVWKQNGPYRLETRFLENHDHDRIAQAFSNSPPAALQTASVYLLTTDGIPFIEAGEEVGITHTLSLFEPDKIQWAAGNTALRDVFKQVLGLRHVNPALSHGDIADGKSSVPGVVAYVRRTPEQQVLVLLCFAIATQHVAVDPAIAGRTGKDLVSGESVDLSKGLDMAPWSWRIIELH